MRKVQEIQSEKTLSFILEDYIFAGAWGLSPVAERSLSSTWTQQLWYMDLVTPQHVGSSFPNQGWNQCPLYWKADSQPLEFQ